MCAREERGTVIANTCRIEQRGKLWIVPSQSGNGTYSVSLTKSFCTCPDFSEGATDCCKHMHAVRLTVSRSVKESDGTTTTTTVTVEQTKRKTYKQDWPNYNKAQVSERGHFMALLADLCKTLPEPEQKKGRGRPALSPADSAYSAILKVYSLISSRRFMGNLDQAKSEGYISKVPHFNATSNFLDTDEATEILQGFIQRSAAPLAAVERKFAIDSTGFSGARYLRWFDEKYGAPKAEVAWVKLHAVTGVFTNVITSCKVMEKNSADSPQMPELLADTAKTFTVEEFSGDKAYAGRINCEAVEAVGGQFYPQFKKNATGGVGGAYKRAYHLFAMNAEEYGRHYHLRSNVESTFSAVKRKFGGELKSKNERSMRNEALAKCVCQNITCLVSAIYELGITPVIGLKESCTFNEKDALLLPVSGV